MSSYSVHQLTEDESTAINRFAAHSLHENARILLKSFHDVVGYRKRKEGDCFLMPIFLCEALEPILKDKWDKAGRGTNNSNNQHR